MAENLHFALTGTDRLSPTLDRAAGSSLRLEQRLQETARRGSTAMDQLTRDANGRLRTLDGRFASARQNAGLFGGSLPGVSSSLGDLAGAGTEAAGKLGPAAGALGGAMKGLAVVAGVSLVPALGALVPAMAGVVSAGAVMKIGFSGIGTAVAAAGGDKKQYREELKKLSPPQREFTKALVGAKEAFKPYTREIQKAMLPAFTRGVKAAGPVMKIFGGHLVDVADDFAGFADSARKALSSEGVQKDLQSVLTMGRTFTNELAGGLGKLGLSFLDFGAASQPTLESLSRGLGDLLGKGLPGMFDGLKIGVEGSSKFLDGLFDAINRVLPAFGRFSGEVARAFGPLLGEMARSAGISAAGGLDLLGKAAHYAAPMLKDLSYGFRAVRDFGALVGPVLKDTAGVIIGSLLPSFSEVEKARGPFRQLSDAVRDNKLAIMEAARQGGSMIIDFVATGVEHLPNLIGVFRDVTGGMVTALGGVLHAAAKTFGWIPGIGDKLKKADAAFAKFAKGYKAGLDTAEEKTRQFANDTLPKLERGKLKLNIKNWQSQIAEAKRQLSDKNLPKEKRGRLKQNIKDWEAKIAKAKKQARAAADGKYTAYMKGNKKDFDKKADSVAARRFSTKTARVRGDKKDFDRKADSVKARRFSSKSVGIRGDKSSFDRTVGGIRGRNLGSAFISIVGRTAGRIRSLLGFAKGGLVGFADGGIVGGFPTGGLLQGPGTGTSDSMLARVSNGEYVIRAAAVDKYGAQFFDQLNQMRLEAGANRGARPLPTPPAPQRATQTARYTTYNVYPRQSVISVEDLRLLQRQEEARQRVGRPQ